MALARIRTWHGRGPLRAGKPLNRGPEVGTVPGVCLVGAPWRYTSVPANLPPQYLKAEDEYRNASERGDAAGKAPGDVSPASQAQGDREAPVGSEAEDQPAQGRAGAREGPGQERRGEPPRAARGGRPGDVDRAAERRKELAPGSTHQRPARDRALSVHDPAASAGNHDVAGCARSACRFTGDLR